MKAQHTDYWINKLSLCQFLEQTVKITKTADEFLFSGWWWRWWLLQELFAGNRQYVNEMVEEHDIWIQQQSFLPLTTDACSQSSSSRTVSVISLDLWQLTARNTHTHTRLMAVCSGLPGRASTRKVSQSGFYWSKRQWVAVASAGPYAICTLLQTDNHASFPPLSFLYAGCPSCRPTNSVKALKAFSACAFSWQLRNLI